MTPATFPLDRADTPIFADGLGERVLAADASTGELLQVLRLRPELTAVPSFEFALRERTARLMNFRHAYYARVRRVDRLPGGGGLAIVFDHVEGTRLSEVLKVAHQRGLQLDTNAALCLIRQLVPAVSLLHENARDASHGLIAPERLVVTPHARLVIVEHVLGSGIEQLQFTRDRLWHEFRIALPSSAGLARFDHRADVNGIGITALSLILGRPLTAEEVPHAVPQLLMHARERTAMGEERPLSNAFRNWLGRTLQLDVRRAFASAPEALAALEETLASDGSYVAAPVALENFLAQYQAALIAPPSPAAPVPLSIVPPPAFAPAVRNAGPAASELPDPFSRTPPAVPSFAPAPPTPAPVVSNPIASAPVASAPAVPPPVAPAPATPPPISFAPVPVSTARAFEPVPSPPARAVEPPPPAAVSGSVPTLADLISLEDLAPQTPGADRARDRPDPPAEEHLRKHAPDPRAAFDEAPDFDALSPFSALDDSLSGTPPAGSFEEPEPAPFPAAATVPVKPAKRGGARIKVIAAVAVLAALISGGVYASSRFYGSKNAVPEMGTLSVQSSPAGVEVFVDGVSRGMTPAQVSVSAGSHILELRGRGVPRVIPLQVPAGGQISQYLEFADTPTTGMLVVHSQPQGANVTVDGTPRGVTPVTVEGLASGDHEVVLQSGTATSRHTVKVLAGTTASLVAPAMAAPPAPVTEGPVSGWVSVKAPFLIEIREDGNLIGTTETARLMLASGRHELEFVNSSLGYKQTRTVQVVPGRVASVSIDLPQGIVNLNASPWAEVWIDGRRVGDTPIGNLAVPIGPHEIVFRHPELGEKKQAVSVTTGAPVRVSVSMK